MLLKVFMAHVEGYTSLEPHGYLTGDYPNGRVVTDDRACPAWPGGVACAVFACGVHDPATGSLTPGYVLCCAVRQLPPIGTVPRGPVRWRASAGHIAADRSQPDAVAGGMRRGRRRDRSYRPH